MKIKSILISITLLFTSTSVLTVRESNITSKQPIKVMQILSINICNSLHEKNKNNHILNNKSLSFEKAIRNGYIVEIPLYNQTEIYNINKLDDFIKSTQKGKKAKIRIVKYAHDNGHTWVNKLYDLEYNGKKIKETVYDVYSDPNAFLPSEPHYFDKIIKRDYPNHIWYGTCLESDKGDNCFSLISFKKSNVVN